MLEYKVFNPSNRERIGPDIEISDLSESIKKKITELLETARVDSEGEDAFESGVYEGKLSDLTGVLGETAIAETMDDLACELSFDTRRTSIETAAWLVFCDEEKQAVFLTELDEDHGSINGHCWKETLYLYNPKTGKWGLEDEGKQYGYENAVEAVDEVFYIEEEGWEDQRIIRIPWDFAVNELGVLSTGGHSKRCRPAKVGAWSNLQRFWECSDVVGNLGPYIPANEDYYPRLVERMLGEGRPYYKSEGYRVEYHAEIKVLSVTVEGFEALRVAEALDLVIGHGSSGHRRYIVVEKPAAEGENAVVVYMSIATLATILSNGELDADDGCEELGLIAKGLNACLKSDKLVDALKQARSEVEQYEYYDWETEDKPLYPSPLDKFGTQIDIDTGEVYVHEIIEEKAGQYNIAIKVLDRANDVERGAENSPEDVDVEEPARLGERHQWVVEGTVTDTKGVKQDREISVPVKHGSKEREIEEDQDLSWTVERLEDLDGHDVLMAQLDAYKRLFEISGDLFKGVACNGDEKEYRASAHELVDAYLENMHKSNRSFTVRLWALKSSAEPYKEKMYDVVDIDGEEGESDPDADVRSVAFNDMFNETAETIMNDDPWRASIENESQSVQIHYQRNSGTWTPTRMQTTTGTILNALNEYNKIHKVEKRIYSDEEIKEIQENAQASAETTIHALNEVIEQKAAEVEALEATVKKLHNELDLAEQIILVDGETYAEKYGHPLEVPYKSTADPTKPQLSIDKKQAQESAQAQAKLNANMTNVAI